MSRRITRKKFGEILVEAGVITLDSLNKALERQKQSGHRLGQVLESMGIIKEADIAVVLARQYDFRTVKDFARFHFPPEVLATVEPAKAKRAQIFPLKIDGNTLMLAMVNPLDLVVIDEIEKAKRLIVKPVVTTPKEIRSAVEAHYNIKPAVIEQIAVASTGWSTILVVEADKAMRSGLTTLLKTQGFHVEEAASQAEALSIAMQLSPHLILIGATQPEALDPKELYHALRGTIPCIAIGWPSLEDEVFYLDAGFTDYLSFPYVEARLLARIRRALKTSTPAH